MTYSFAGFQLTSPIINAPMPKAWYADGMKLIADQPVGAVVTKSVTLHAREGNESPREYYDAARSLNAVGLANDGVLAHLGYVETLAEYTDKPIIMNVSAFSVAEYAEVFENAMSAPQVDIVEVNLSCPNTEAQVFAENPELIEDVLLALAPIREKYKKPMGIKVNPCTNLAKIRQIVEVLVRHNVDFVTATNTLGNCRLLKPDGEPVIKANGGYGGMAGAAILPLALSTVSLYRKAIDELKSDMAIVGVGGVTTGADVQAHLNAGATVVGMASVIMHEGYDALGRVSKEWEEINA
jgi:dihydroorotate dehydrogenase (fumarate)